MHPLATSVSISFIIPPSSFILSLVPLTFRPATAADIPLLRDLASRIWRTCYPGVITVEQIDYMLAWMYSAEKIAEELTTGVLWEIALLDDTPAGYLSLTFGTASAELHKLYLLPALHGQGLGQAMLARALAQTAAHGNTELRLRVNKGNARALRSYARAGFRIVDSVVVEIGGGFVMDDYLLVRPLATR